MKELLPLYFNQKSFYGKAHYHSQDKNVILYSYNYPIAKIDENGVMYIARDTDNWDSNTTLKHIREFYRQFKDESTILYKSDLQKMPLWDFKGEKKWLLKKSLISWKLA